jgi:HrpA-like RNA helicase
MHPLVCVYIYECTCIHIQAARLNLPVCGMEQEIVEAITLNDVVILCGETGSGKSTQGDIYVFLYLFIYVYIYIDD